jgi:hypothetical protein
MLQRLTVATRRTRNAPMHVMKPIKEHQPPNVISTPSQGRFNQPGKGSNPT